MFLGGRTVFNEDERQLGEMLKEQEKNKGAATPLHDERASVPTLKDQGISEIQSHRWQKVAKHQSPTP